MKDDGEERYIIVLDPWRKSFSMSDPLLSGPGHEIHYEKKTLRTLSVKSLVF